MFLLHSIKKHPEFIHYKQLPFDMFLVNFVIELYCLNTCGEIKMYNVGDMLYLHCCNREELRCLGKKGFWEKKTRKSHQCFEMNSTIN